jgi:hypothetical protein
MLSPYAMALTNSLSRAMVLSCVKGVSALMRDEATWEIAESHGLYEKTRLIVEKVGLFLCRRPSPEYYVEEAG